MARLTYLFDPLCGWCYGASPALSKLMGRNDLEIELLPTGLFAGEGAFDMDDGFAAHAWENDQRIARLSGQSFSAAYRLNVLGNRKSRVDSGPATLALVAVRLTTPKREFEALEAIQRIRYVDGYDNGSPAVVAKVLHDLRLNEAAARFALPDPALQSACRTRVEEGRAEMRRFNVRGVPALIVDQGASRRLVDAAALFDGADVFATSLETSRAS